MSKDNSLKKGVNSGVDGLSLLTFGFLFQASQKTAPIIERFGKFNKVGSSGINFKIPLIDQIVTIQSLRVQQIEVRVSAKTKDNVFIDLTISTQYRIEDNNDKIFSSFYALEDVEKQINSYLFDATRTSVASLTLDEIFEKKDQIASEVKTNLSDSMNNFGYEIVNTLITDVIVDKRIVQAMNEIVASQKEREAATQKGEANKILMVKAAEAESESKELQGKGIANQRKAIILGFKDSIQVMTEIPNVDTKEILNLVLLTQYFDTLKDVAQSSSNTILLPGGISGFNNVADQIRESVITGNLIDATSKQ